MSFHLLCRAALAIVAAVTVVSYTVGFPGTALPDGAVAALALAPGAASVAALLLLPALDRGWAYAAGALVLLATPGITAAAAAALVAPSATLATIMHDDEAMAAAFAVAERNFAPAFVASAALLIHAMASTPRSSRKLGTAAEAALLVVFSAMPVLTWLFYRVDFAPCNIVSSAAGTNTVASEDPARSLRTLLIMLNGSAAACFALTLAKSCVPKVFNSVAVIIIIPALLIAVHVRGQRVDYNSVVYNSNSEQQASDDFHALRVAALGSPMLLGLSVLEMLRVLRVVVVTVVLPLLSVTVMAQIDVEHCEEKKTSSDVIDLQAHPVTLEKQRLIEVV